MIFYFCYLFRRSYAVIIYGYPAWPIHVLGYHSHAICLLCVSFLCQPMPYRLYLFPPLDIFMIFICDFVLAFYIIIQ